MNINIKKFSDIYEKLCSNFKIRLFVEISLFVLYIIIVSFTAFHHEMWRDEIRVWYIISHYTPREFFDIIRFEGHPHLWYEIMYPFYKLHFNETTVQFFGCAFSFFAAFLVCFKLRAGLIFKFLFLFSSGMLWFMPVLSRNYCLAPAFLILWAMFYNKRISHPFWYVTFLILLSQSHMLIWAFCFLLLIIFCGENVSLFIKNKNPVQIYPILYILFFICIMSATYFPVFVDNPCTGNVLNAYCSLPFWHNFNNIFKSFYFDDIHCISLFKYLLYVCLICIVALLVKYDKKLGITVLISSIYMISVNIILCTSGVFAQKLYVFFLTVLFSALAVLYSPNFIKHKQYNVLKLFTSIFVFLIFITFPAFDIISDDIKHNYSNVKTVSQFIIDKKINKDEYVIINPSDGIWSDAFYIYLKDAVDKTNFIKPDNNDYNVNSPYIEKLKKNNKNLKYLIINCLSDYQLLDDKYEEIIQDNDSPMTFARFDDYYKIYKIKE